MGLRESLEQLAQRRMLAEDGDLEVVPAEPPHAAPGRERGRVEQHRPARRRAGVELVPPPVRLGCRDRQRRHGDERRGRGRWLHPEQSLAATPGERRGRAAREERSEEHTSDSSHGYISYAVFCLKKKKKQK